MAANNPSKRYAKDLGVAIPKVFDASNEAPRLDTTVAPYLPLQLENERHDFHYVILTGKVVALDSMGFLVPAGYAIQRELAVAAGDGAAWPAECERYDAVDVAEAVVNARGVLVQDGEPVMHAVLSTAAYNDGDDTVDLLNAPATALTFGNHIGQAPYSFVRASSDVMSRAADENVFEPSAVTGKEALVPYNPNHLRHNALEHQNRLTVHVSRSCLILPVVTDLDGLLIEGQTVAIGANMAAFQNGSYVTFDENSNIVPLDGTALAVADLLPDFAVDADADIMVAVLNVNARIVGQVTRRQERYPSSYLDKVKTRWEPSVPGMTELDRMPGSATGGYPWNMHTAGSTIGEIQISPLMR